MSAGNSANRQNPCSDLDVTMPTGLFINVMKLGGRAVLAPGTRNCSASPDPADSCVHLAATSDSLAATSEFDGILAQHVQPASPDIRVAGEGSICFPLVPAIRFAESLAGATKRIRISYERTGCSRLISGMLEPQGCVTISQADRTRPKSKDLPGYERVSGHVRLPEVTRRKMLIAPAAVRGFLAHAKRLRFLDCEELSRFGRLAMFTLGGRAYLFAREKHRVLAKELMPHEYSADTDDLFVTIPMRAALRLAPALNGMQPWCIGQEGNEVRLLDVPEHIYTQISSGGTAFRVYCGTAWEDREFSQGSGGFTRGSNGSLRCRTEDFLNAITSIRQAGESLLAMEYQPTEQGGHQLRLHRCNGMYTDISCQQVGRNTQLSRYMLPISAVIDLVGHLGEQISLAAVGRGYALRIEGGDVAAPILFVELFNPPEDKSTQVLDGESSDSTCERRVA